MLSVIQLAFIKLIKTTIYIKPLFIPAGLVYSRTGNFGDGYEREYEPHHETNDFFTVVRRWSCAVKFGGCNGARGRVPALLRAA